MLSHELVQHRVHLVGGRGVELAGRLVGEEELRPVRDTFARIGALRAASVLGMLWTISLLGTYTGSEFIYFQF